MYTVPVGQNPCGCTMTGDRKKAVYELAVKHDIIIVEDDRKWKPVQMTFLVANKNF